MESLPLEKIVENIINGDRYFTYHQWDEIDALRKEGLIEVGNKRNQFSIYDAKTGQILGEFYLLNK